MKRRFPKYETQHKSLSVMAPWCSGYHYGTTSFNQAWTHILRRFKPCSQRVWDLRWWESLTMVPTGNKAWTPFVSQPFYKNNSSSSSSHTRLSSYYFEILNIVTLIPHVKNLKTISINSFRKQLLINVRKSITTYQSITQ